MSWVQTVKLGLCFFTWFFLNVMYNITNKKCQNAFPMPWTMTFVSLAVGARRTPRRGRRHAHARAQSHLFYSVGWSTWPGRAHGRSTSRPRPRCARRHFSRGHFATRARPHRLIIGGRSPVSRPLPTVTTHLLTLVRPPPLSLPRRAVHPALSASGAVRKAPKFNPGWWKVRRPLAPPTP